ncbi:MAG: hypothetical protein AB7F22_32145, partial [Reyranella sp.]|uniref:hypothetical protein n=1 Tax=Reyranella sp. TaxID=1929291 RepID=UPI003D0F763D
MPRGACQLMDAERIAYCEARSLVPKASSRRRLLASEIANAQASSSQHQSGFRGGGAPHARNNDAREETGEEGQAEEERVKEL